MDLLQKLTLYDLLGYTLPGCILLAVSIGETAAEWFAQADNQNGIGAAAVFILICSGYILGIIISECMSWILETTGQTKISGKMYKKYHVDDERIRQSLKNAGMIQDSVAAKGKKLFKRYHGEMYAKIQADEKYFRIHNYASAELLYKNMIFVSAVGTASSLFKGELCGMLLGVGGTVCFFMRWKRFYEKKLGYCLGWFLDKYDFKP